MPSRPSSTDALAAPAPDGETPPAPRVRAVIVCHHPDPPLLDQAIAAAAAQADRVLVIANDRVTPPCPMPPTVDLLVPERNLGLGAAYNAAARWAAANGATHLLLLDQDSVPAPGMVAALLDALDRAGAPPVAAAGPLWRDRRCGREGHFVRIGRFGVRRCRPPPGAVVPVDFLVSSGSLVRLDALAAIGAFDEALFIDHVDTDWSLRARAAGWRLLGVAGARLDHALGGGGFPGLVGRLAPRLVLYAPDRHYYLVRNSLVLWRRSHAPWGWVLSDLQRTGGIVLAHLLFAPRRRRRLVLIARGIRDAHRATDDPKTVGRIA